MSIVIRVSEKTLDYNKKCGRKQPPSYFADQEESVKILDNVIAILDVLGGKVWLDFDNYFEKGELYNKTMSELRRLRDDYANDAYETYDIAVDAMIKNLKNMKKDVEANIFSAWLLEDVADSHLTASILDAEKLKQYITQDE